MGHNIFGIFVNRYENRKMESKQIKFLKSTIQDKGGIDLGNLKLLLARRNPSLSENDLDELIQKLTNEKIICLNTNDLFVVCENAPDFTTFTKATITEEIEFHDKEKKRSDSNSKFNFKKGILRIHILISLIILPICSIVYYFSYRKEASQNLVLKDGESFNVYPYIANNAHLNKRESEIENLFNSKNSEFYPSGYDFRLSPNSDWNLLIQFLYKHNFPFPDGAEQFQSLSEYIFFTNNKNCPEILIEKNNDSWGFNSNKGELQFSVNNKEISVNLNNKKDFIVKNKSNVFDSWPTRPLFADTNNVTYTLYRRNNDFFVPITLVIVNDSLKNEIPSLNNQAPFFFKSFPSFDDEFYANYSSYYEGQGYSAIFGLHHFFIEPPFLSKIQTVFSTKKQNLTTTQFFGFVLVIILFYWILYLVISIIIRWLKNGFLSH